MKFVIVFAALFAVAIAAPPQSAQETQILRSESNVQPESYNYAYETSDGKSASEEGKLKNTGTDQSRSEFAVVSGQFSYTGEEVIIFVGSYIADENGFQPIVINLQTAPFALVPQF